MSNPITRSFNKATFAALARKGIAVIDVGMADNYGFVLTYTVNDNGCSKVWKWADVMAAAGK